MELSRDYLRRARGTYRQASNSVKTDGPDSIFLSTNLRRDIQAGFRFGDLSPANHRQRPNHLLRCDQCQRLADQGMRDRVVDSIVMARQSVAAQNFWWKMRLWRAAIPDWVGAFDLRRPVMARCPVLRSKDARSGHTSVPHLAHRHD